MRRRIDTSESISAGGASTRNGYAERMLSKKQLMRECTALANSPLSLSIPELERLELSAIEAVRESGPGCDSAKLILRMASEIRKVRGLWDHDGDMTQREIDDELAMLRGQS